MNARNVLLAVGAALATLFVGPKCAPAEIIELTNGQVLQGDIVAGQTNEDGLAVNVFDTNGVVIVKWDHIEESRRKALRLEHGVDLPEETVELVHGNKVMLASGEVIYGVAENPRDSAPLRMRTRSGVKEYDRSALQSKVEDVEIDGLLVYSVEDLYQKLLAESPPETAAAHKLFATKCINIGAYDHAKEHILAAKADPIFPETLEGKALDGMLQRVDLLIRAKGAADMVTQIKQAMSGQKWNDALTLLNKLDADAQYKDEAIRNAIGFKLLEQRVVQGRDKYFHTQIAIEVFHVMENMIEAKARERKPIREPSVDPNAPAAKPGAAAPGTLAAAKTWANRELDKELWEKVSTDLALSKDDIDKYWKDRVYKSIKHANYGTGSFIVVKKTPAQKPAGGGGATPPDKQPRRPPGSNKPDKNKNGKAPEKAPEVEKPLTEEEWWDITGPGDRANWLRAYFVETCQHFTILGTPQVNCDGCGGTGFIKGLSSNGDDTLVFCKRCNSCGLFRSVNYR